ncbi:MAG: hypothetical protein J7M25_01115, partial [Deltaproteobacteria bacterium]|nr:hypothetical protein [Deltaproteobacteria bacterium]
GRRPGYVFQLDVPVKVGVSIQGRSLDTDLAGGKMALNRRVDVELVTLRSGVPVGQAVRCEGDQNLS